MKKILLTLLLATSLIACEKNEVPQPVSPKTNNTPTPTVTQHTISIQASGHIYHSWKVNGQDSIPVKGSNGLYGWNLKTGDYIRCEIEFLTLYTADGPIESATDMSLTIYDNNILVWTKTAYSHSISYGYKVP
jgi:hypothetical protein